MKRLLLVMTVVIAGLISVNVAKADSMSAEAGPQIVKEANLLVEKLKLKGDTAVEFTKIYADYRTEMEELLSKNKPIKPACVNGKKQPLTDEQVDENIRNGFKVGHKMIEVREKYYKKFKTILSPSQINRMFRYEKKIMDRKRSEMKRREDVREKDSLRRDRIKKSNDKRQQRVKKNAERRKENAKHRAEKHSKKFGKNYSKNNGLSPLKNKELTPLKEENSVKE